ncbi:ExeM/NucH family extracellular endonuclease [Vibrio vulnificus]|uniref:ExeM/NucH family extracellular endonuclease n=1 Tax=Vibrio vulnificus TaxID=672 RepID=UPI0005F1D40B|nr:ExeM/NucH family extracellular endonuclease [Vibrio vulnificus]EJL6391068.1 ExeM/NucH family extracellular endonuclease [Vibrio vulnificus]EJO2020761.1 ExeM/NucH family extracellular endonuclease [Vibrio vulnificus]EKO5176527.1 ExeM/NucH family extracellular endonuclease [Vibrio vulnificus]EKO5196106.1 ExeM/NucH family extracellular endonuclease [Vibrio vulnificus]ELH9602807.1 ExeM/NucH family extracellular endonuclease [Vibrio vulnificus]
MNKKMTLLAGAISSVLSGAALADINDIIITEYVEGSASNKAVEISNIGTSNHTFDGTLSLYYSSYKNVIKNSKGQNVLEGITLAPGKSIVVVNGDSSTELRQYVERLGGKDALVVAGTYDQVQHSAMNFNGDDAVWLGVGSDASGVKDIFGNYGHSGDKIWADQTMRRKSGSKPSTTYQEAEWEKLSINAFGGLGHPTDVNDEPLPPPPANLPCTDAEGTVSYKTIGEVQGEAYSSPLIESGYTSKEEYLVTGVVSAVATSLVKGFYLYDDNADGNVKTSDGVFVKTSGAVSKDMIGQQICVRAKVNEDYGMTTLLPTDDIWEVKNSTQVAVEPVSLVRIDSDDTFRSTLERLEGMLVKTSADMGKTALELAAIEALVEQVTVERVDGEDEKTYEARLEAAKKARKDELIAEKYDMRVSRTFSFDYSAKRNNMVIAYKRPNPQPNQDHVAGSDAAKAQTAQNKDYRIVVESDEKPADGKIPYYPEFGVNNIEHIHSNYIRINDSIVGMQGVLHYSYNEFRLIPMADVTKANFIHNTPRTKSPKISESYGDDGFTVKVATQNVLNYFNSPYGGHGNQFGDNRGAKSQQEFERQQAKIVEAIYGLDADIVGLMEVENNGFGDFSAIRELLEALNAKYDQENYGDRFNSQSIHNRYVFVGFDKNGDQVLDQFDTIGSDVITTGVIYRPSKVALYAGKVIEMPWQDAPMVIDEDGEPVLDSKGEVAESGKNYQRNTIAATFRVLNTDKLLTVAINHLKSKGSTCWDDYVGTKAVDNDAQGSCENFRVASTYHLGEELAKIGGDQVVLGDMNSYAHEDPMLVLTSNPTGKELKAADYVKVGNKWLFNAEQGPVISKTFGYINAVDYKTPEGETSWSYSYNDEVGSLDHLLISSSLEKRLVDAVDWHINAPESALFDYSSKYKGGNANEEANPFYAETAYRSSDHDSALVTIGYKYGETSQGSVVLGTKSDRVDVPFAIMVEAKKDGDGSELPAKGDIAEISISPLPANIAMSKEVLSKAGNQTVKFDVAGLPKGEYTITMTLTRPATDKAAEVSKVIYSKSMDVVVTKRDSSNVKPAVPAYDGSGGAFGFGALLSLFGFGFLRRRRSL